RQPVHARRLDLTAHRDLEERLDDQPRIRLVHRQYPPELRLRLADRQPGQRDVPIQRVQDRTVLPDLELSAEVLVDLRGAPDRQTYRVADPEHRHVALEFGNL